ncbi:mechanosensitive ion channel domain-containing protein [Rhodoferax sp.]|uniref:mechanosensitive ion channel family protein n=1 Tax=Rhodoferax sp. TaxID=50421 RepID=UPI0025CD2512|nr:mechanosensitive ion channel domain-containing protein [Rhodoferax sp.]MCM2342812.1 mechanosensitive ion channel [Rhodoferax sp.]
MSEPVITDLQDWLAALSQTSVLIELGALLACGLLAWLLARLVSRAFVERELNSIMFGRRIVDGVLFPALWLCLAYAARKLLDYSMPLALFKLAIPVLISLLVIRLGVKVLQAAFNNTPAIRLLERSISWIAWAAMVLWVSGLLPLLMDELDQISWTVGGASLSVRKIIEGTLTAGLVLIISLWISSAIETKLLRKATGGELSLRKAFSNAARALLMFVGLLLALSAVGIDLTALSVLGGAIGVGIGFGLQKLAANYVSGFVILAERSMRIGDSVQVDNFSGVITQINARYTVIRSLAGRESIVPNEMLITSRVENLSLADPRVWQSTNVSVAYDSDVDLVSRLLLQAAATQERVLADPGPAVVLLAFGADGLEFRLGYWIGDPENGSDNLRSLINLEILRLLREHRVEIPFPQRVIHTRPV